MNIGILFDLAAFVVALSIIYATAMWWIEWKYRYPIPIQNLARIFAIAFSIQGLIYLVFSFLLIDIELRSYLVRVSISVICLSQAIPLHMAYRTSCHV
ncbi:MAG: hypothetical protein EHM40_11070 [Chloroflexi bacterium]|nr:MAG: hypothetical protein EHM40_11070 [Chloroflexota bacterium]